MRQAIACLAASVLTAAPVAAETREWKPSEKALAKRLAKVGRWEFSALAANADGQPECRELWFFGRDGTGWVQSGEERVTNRWRILSTVTMENERLVYITALTTTGAPDCMGNPADPASYPETERGFYVRFTAKNTALICGLGEFQHSFDYTKKAPLANGREDCWGRITAVAKD